MSPEAAVDYYRVLGVRRDASEKQIQKAYRTWVRRTHPDHNPDPDALPFGAPDIILINEAWSVLGDPDRRAAYDDTLGDAPMSHAATLAARLPPVPNGFNLHPRPNWGGWTSWPRSRGADAVRGALSLWTLDRDLSGLSSLAPDQLWLLDARDLPITDDDLKPLARFYRLEVLALDGTGITDRGLEIVRNFPELRVISLTDCKIGDDSARILGSVKTLQDVELDETAVSDEGVFAFAGHPELTVLDLRKTKVTGDGLNYLVDVPKLRELRLSARAERKARRLFRDRPEMLIL